MRYFSKKTYDDFDYDNDIYDNDVYEKYNSNYEETYSTTYDYYDEYQDEEISEIKEKTDKIDDDLVDYFSDARIGRIKTNKKKKNLKQKKKVSFSSGDIVFVKQDGNEFKASIIYGPYEVDKKRLYEAEINGGEIVEIDERFIQEKVE